RNEVRAQRARQSAFFAQLHNPDIRQPQRSAALTRCLRVFSDAFQVIMFTRQATCRDERFRSAFLRHLREELGHNELLLVSEGRALARDPILSATASWFCHQMLTLDNAGKSVVNLVLETAGDYFHSVAE